MSQSRFEELRNYRINGLCNSKSKSESPSKLKVSAGRKRIRVASDSSEDGEPSGQSASQPHQNGGAERPALSIYEREERLMKLRRMFPSRDLMKVQDELTRSDWNVEKAADRLKASRPTHSSSAKTYPQVSASKEIAFVVS